MQLKKHLLWAFLIVSGIAIFVCKASLLEKLASFQKIDRLVILVALYLFPSIGLLISGFLRKDKLLAMSLLISFFIEVIASPLIVFEGNLVGPYASITIFFLCAMGMNYCLHGLCAFVNMIRDRRLE